MTRSAETGTIGVLALQGDYACHQRTLRRLGVESRQIRKPDELEGIRGLILPGGESTTMLKFLQEERLMEPLRRLYAEGAALYGTCAGAILLAKEVVSPAQPSLELMDIRIERNAYGRQVDSHEKREPCPALGDEPLPMIFIRAPVILDTSASVEILARHRGRPVLVRQDRMLASTFHPELSDDDRVHRYFLEHVMRS